MIICINFSDIILWAQNFSDRTA